MSKTAKEVLTEIYHKQNVQGEAGLWLGDADYVKNLEATIKDLRDALELGVVNPLKYFDSIYKDTEWDICCIGHGCACQGMPNDPEYYIYRDMKKAHGILEKHKEILETIG